MKYHRLALLLIVAELALVIVSWLLSATMTPGVRSLLSGEGIRWFFGRFTLMVASPPLAWLLLAAVAAGAFSRSGLATAIRPGWSFRERTALGAALALAAACIGVVAALTLIPHAVLLSASGRLFPSPFSRALLPVAAFVVTAASVVYGLVAGRLKTPADVFESLTFGISKGAPLFLLYILLIQFYESLRFVFM